MTDSNMSPAVMWRDDTGVQHIGYILNTAYCPTRDRWQMLVMEEGGGFHNVHAEGLEVEAMWMIPASLDEDDDDDGS